jgi:hypothetical protein
MAQGAGEQRIDARHIRRVGHDQVEAFVRQRGKPVRLDEPDFDAEPARVVSRNLQRRRADVDCRNSDRLRGVPDRDRNRNRDRPAAGAEVEHGAAPGPGERCQRLLDQQLRFRTRHQRMLIHHKLERVELSTSGDLRDRNALRAAFDRGEVRRGDFVRDAAFRKRDHGAARTACKLREQQLGIEASALARLGKPVDAEIQQFAQRPSSDPRP